MLVPLTDAIGWCHWLMPFATPSTTEPPMLMPSSNKYKNSFSSLDNFCTCNCCCSHNAHAILLGCCCNSQATTPRAAIWAKEVHQHRHACCNLQARIAEVHKLACDQDCQIIRAKWLHVQCHNTQTTHYNATTYAYIMQTHTHIYKRAVSQPWNTIFSCCKAWSNINICHQPICSAAAAAWIAAP